MDPSPGSPWNKPETVAGFTTTPPNLLLLQFAEQVLRDAPGGLALDIGCGAGRNALPLAEQGWRVLGLDSSPPMLEAVVRAAGERHLGDRLHVALATMDRLPVRDRCCNLLVAHGIWNLARSDQQFRDAVAEAARVAAAGARLFLFTFSRTTLSPRAQPVPAQSFVFTDFAGQPQCFLTEAQLFAELDAAGFVPDLRVPLRELNRPQHAALRTQGLPVIYETAFRYSISDPSPSPR